MNLTKLSLSNPVAVVVGILLVVMFGTISLFRLPIQMTPDVERPQVVIQTTWRAAAPEEVESEIIEPQEDVLRGLPGMVKLESSAAAGRAGITITLDVDTDMQETLIEVLNRLNRVPSYPADANEPILFTGGNSNFTAIAWFALRPLEGNERDMATYQDYVEEVVQSRIERVPGIANSNAYGGRGQEVRVEFDPYRASAYGIDIPRLASMTGGNTDTSGGFADVGRRQYTVRFAGQYDVSEMEDMVLDWRDGNPVRLGDIATVKIDYRDFSGRLTQNGGPSIAINAQAEQGINVLEVMDDLKATVVELNEGPLKQAGLFLTQVYDETEYINASIAMLRNNLLLGIGLAIAILWWFLRRFRATLMVALAIPTSLMITFIMLNYFGRTLNIISLAGLAFAVGMVLDAAIVVLENIVRLRERGEEGFTAAEHGASQVWGALLASTATTVAIFLPVLFIRDLSGQLFADLAIAISVAIVASLLIAVTVIPTLSATSLQRATARDPHAGWWEKGTAMIMNITSTPKKRTGWIAGLMSIPVLVAVLLLPTPDYLPDGKQNLIFAFIAGPPGNNARTGEEELVKVINERMAPYLAGEKEPAISSNFLGVFGSGGFMGARAEDPDKVDELLNLLNGQILRGLPDTLAFGSRRSLFGNVSGGRVVDVDIQSRDTNALLDAAAVGFAQIPQIIPGARVQPIPGLELGEPELRLIPDERRIAEAGWDRRTVANVIRAMGDGLFVGDYFDGDKRIDMVLRAGKWDTPEELEALPVSTPNMGVIPLGELVDIERTAGPNQIRRVDRRRTVTLRVTPPSDMSISDAIDLLRDQAAPAIRAALPEDGSIQYAGTAGNLKNALVEMSSSFALAIAILYLLMSALFRSFKDSLLVVMALPLATVGGVIMLRIVNLFTFQPMDLLTMIGFITVLGLVVNNAILLVHQTRAAEREGMLRREAVEQAVRLRLRPILMSTMTSLFGMLPLVLIPGAGTELYRGMASVIVGGMAVSTVFTLILLPSLLRIGEDVVQRSAAGSAWEGQPAAPSREP
ncbi:MAG: efflux RND transporter permease subunit [Gammaproteobacteria bacterium]|nr:efflux RND transporter permease subunit [Gammaproteobacteria bacterium]